jgi:hypothetical protein
MSTNPLLHCAGHGSPFFNHLIQGAQLLVIWVIGDPGNAGACFLIPNLQRNWFQVTLWIIGHQRDEGIHRVVHGCMSDGR